MKLIYDNKNNYLIVSTKQGTFHISEYDGVTKIYMFDHFSIDIEGESKRTPKITIDSDEYDTELVINETESHWIKK